MTTVFVTGGTGLIGSNICEQLLARGDSVKALARPGSDTSELRALGVTIAEGDITDAASVRDAAEGCEYAIHSAAVLGGASQDRGEHERVNTGGVSNVFDAAEKHGMRRVVTDNRLHRWEWLRLPDGRLMKSDALDHATAHDLIGCQDIAWDVAGGIVEFDLSDAQAEALCRMVEGAVPLDRRLLAFCIPCYIAFQIGYWTFAAGSDPSAADERRRYEERWRQFCLPSKDAG